MSCISKKFEELKAADRAAFMPFLAAGDPDLETSMRLLEEAAARGADLIELGIPFSDPIADGPVIQAAYTRALAGGLKVRAIFQALADVRQRVGIPVVCMVSVSIVRRKGQQAFFKMAARAGADGVIIPDLPPEDGESIYEDARRMGLDTILLAAPTTDPKRRDRILARASGFLYYISITGITGVRERLPEDMARQLADLKSRTRLPVCLGFGVGTTEQAAAVARAADGVIVGSAIVKRVHAAAQAGRDAARELGPFLEELALAVHGEGGEGRGEKGEERADDGHCLRK